MAQLSAHSRSNSIILSGNSPLPSSTATTFGGSFSGQDSCLSQLTPTYDGIRPSSSQSFRNTLNLPNLSNLTNQQSGQSLLQQKLSTPVKTTRVVFRNSPPKAKRVSDTYLFPPPGTLECLINGGINLLSSV